MKKIILFLALFLFVSPVFADAIDETMDVWNANTLDNNFKGQQMITDEQFNKVIDKLKEKEEAKKKKKWWQRTPPEIKPLSPVPETSNMFQYSELAPVIKKVEHFPTVMISVPVSTSEDITLQPGFYKLSTLKENNVYYLMLSQGPNTVKVRAKQVSEDYSKLEMNYGDAVVVDDRHIKLIYGNIDLNLEAYLYIK